MVGEEPYAGSRVGVCPSSLQISGGGMRESFSQEGGGALHDDGEKRIGNLLTSGGDECMSDDGRHIEENRQSLIVSQIHLTDSNPPCHEKGSRGNPKALGWHRASSTQLTSVISQLIFTRSQAGSGTRERGSGGEKSLGATAGSEA